MSIEDKQYEIIDELTRIPDWSDKYEHIIEVGGRLPLINPQYKSPDTLIKGCQSKVWIYAEKMADRMFLTADSDSAIIKGIVSLIVYVYSGHTPEEIIFSELFFLERTGLARHMSNRSSGIKAMISQVNSYATNFNQLRSREALAD